MDSDFRRIAHSGFAVSFATIFTHPIDKCKVRLQLENQGGAKHFSFRAVYQIASVIGRTEGLHGFFSGLSPALGRAVLYGGVRLGFYDPIRRQLGSDGPVGNTFAAFASGSLAAVVGNPLEVLKVRMQANSGHRSVASCAAEVFKTRGLGGFGRGMSPAVTRSALLTASQIIPYRYSKKALLQYLDDGFCVHLFASLLAGIVTTTVTSPFDVIKTRAMIHQQGPWRCAVDMVQTEGWISFLRGWNATYVRLGPQTALIFLAYEQIRKLC